MILLVRSCCELQKAQPFCTNVLDLTMNCKPHICRLFALAWFDTRRGFPDVKSGLRTSACQAFSCRFAVVKAVCFYGAMNLRRPPKAMMRSCAALEKHWSESFDQRVPLDNITPDTGCLLHKFAEAYKDNKSSLTQCEDKKMSIPQLAKKPRVLRPRQEHGLSTAVFARCSKFHLQVIVRRPGFSTFGKLKPTSSDF